LILQRRRTVKKQTYKSVTSEEEMAISLPSAKTIVLALVLATLWNPACMQRGKFNYR